jgi:alginate O-acetyltransferase complex protein AlgI
MLFSSLTYLPFLGAVTLVFLLLNPGRQRLWLLAISSYIFYGLFQASYIFILAAITALSYSGAIFIEDAAADSRRANTLALTVIATFAFLIFFKYFNFISVTSSEAANIVGFNITPYVLDIVLPVGISFYTFHSVAYVVDVYVGKIRAERRLLNYVVFICFFPQLLAGPIERGGNVLPQLGLKAQFDYDRIVGGLREILMGLTMKVLCADTLAIRVDPVYSNPANYNGWDHIWAAVCFAFQVYGDFAGYSLIALGSAHILGVNLMANFRQPFLAQTIPEFWRTWHISLSTWLQDYLYTPLRLRWREYKIYGLYMALAVTFLVAGIWHGAGWKYILFGIIHAVYMILSIATLEYRDEFYSALRIPGLCVRVWRTIATFSLVAFSFILFRAQSASDALLIYQKLGALAVTAVPIGFSWKTASIIVFLLMSDIAARMKFGFGELPALVRWVIYYGSVGMIGYAMVMRYGHEQPFIYFKF